MAIQPGQYNICLQRRADHPLRLQFKDNSGTAIDLTNWTVSSQVWDRKRTTKYADFQVTYTDRANGTVDLLLTDTQTATFPDEAYYDVLLDNGSGLQEYYLEGVIYVSEGYTA